MALVNDIYVFVESEEVSRDTTASSHPVEEGISLTDHVRRSPLTLSLSGEIVGSDYEDDVSELDFLHRSGELVEYVGINVLSDALITRFSTSHFGNIRGGCTFSMELKEVRIAHSPFGEGSGNSTSQQVEEAPSTSVQGPPIRTHTVKSGDRLWSIAKSYYGNGALFPRIFDANRDKLSDPDVIQVGQVLVIP